MEMVIYLCTPLGTPLKGRRERVVKEALNV